MKHAGTSRMRLLMCLLLFLKEDPPCGGFLMKHAGTSRMRLIMCLLLFLKEDPLLREIPYEARRHLAHATYHVPAPFS